MISFVSFRNGGAYNAIHQSKNKLPRIAGAGIRAESRYGKSDRTFASRLGIHSLPAYLMQYEDKTILMQSFEYQDFSDALKSLMQ